MSKNTSTTELVTQYGIRQPNGEEIWDGMVKLLDRSNYARETTIQKIHEDTYQRDQFIRHLRKTAETVGINADQFAADHTLITRQVITITLAPERSEIRLGEMPVPF